MQVDLWIEDMLVDLFLNVIPPNPFPVIVHHLRQLSYRYLLKDTADRYWPISSCSSECLCAALYWSYAVQMLS